MAKYDYEDEVENEGSVVTTTRIFNGKTGWIVGGLGIPLAAILTWVFSAGQLSYITNQNAKNIEQHEQRLRAVENSQIKVDGQYQNIMTEIQNMKNDIHDLKNGGHK